MPIVKKNNPFKITRLQHSKELAQDYTEIIYELINEKGVARVGEIAYRLGVSHVTAIKALKRLQEQGLVLTKPKSPIELTLDGKKLAKFSKYRHELLLKMLIKIGVPEELAKIDVEGAEHHFSKKTLKYIESFIKKEK